VVVARLLDDYPFLQTRPGYFYDPLLNDVDIAIRNLVVSLEGKDLAAWNGFMNRVLMDEARMLLCFALRMATYAVRTSSPIQVRFGLLALVLGHRGEDWREVLIDLGVVYDASNRSGGDAKELFEDVAGIVPADGADLLRGFLRRPDLDDILAVMWYAAEQDEAGAFVYRHRPPPLPKPPKPPTQSR
jgi:hypothetical protein